MRNLAKFLIRILPFKESILHVGASLPTSLKGYRSERLFGAVARALGPATACVVKTNLGLDAQLQISLPASAPAVYLFATPQQYVGERAAVSLAVELAGSASAFIDVGAHFGYFVFAVVARYGTLVPIYYFEPNQKLFEIVDNNVHSLGLSQVIGHCAAMGEQDGIVRFYLSDSDPSLSSLDRKYLDHLISEAIEVPITRFDSFTERNHLRDLVVKVDVENAEFRILDGIGAAGERIAHLIIEILGPAVTAGFVTEAASRLGMEPYYINDYRLEHAPDGVFQYVAPQYNWLFTRLAPQELSDRLRSTRFEVVGG